MARVTINGITFDPVIESAALTAASPDSGNASHSNYVLIQVRGPLSGDERQQLDERGANIQEYVSEDTYLCSFGVNDLAMLRDLPFVVWSDVYLRIFKIEPALRGARPPLRVAELAEAAGPNASRRMRQVDVLFHVDVDPDSEQLRERVAAAARLNVESLQ
ncbi:MAG: peptidase, partial [Blastococcus sp.]|nr:peptidase [Blastococcus sp.]